MSPVVKEEFGPTLREVLRPLPRGLRWAIVLALVTLAATGLWLLSGGTPDKETHVVVREPFAFNLAYGPRLKAVEDQSASLRVEERRDGEFMQSFAVRPLLLPPYRGTPAGTFPLYASAYVRELRRTYRGFDLVSESRTRINENPGYQIIFRADLDGRALYGRHILLVPALDADEDLALDTVREGAILELTATFASGTPNATSTGDVGALKKPLRSFRFGTERSGGTESP